MGPGGGGSFENEKIVQLNLYKDSFRDGVKIPTEAQYGEFGEQLSLPKEIRIKYLDDLDEFQDYLQKNIKNKSMVDSFFDPHLRRGWELIEKPEKIIEQPPGLSWQKTDDSPGSKIWLTYDSPRSYQRVFENDILRMLIRGYGEKNGPNAVIEYSFKAKKSEDWFDFGRLDWADWDKNGDLLFANEGKLYRVKRTSKSAYDLEKATELADFNNLKFEEKVAPKNALKW